MKERDLQLLRAESDSLQSRLEEQERRVLELEEQIENDDTVEKLEAKLKHTQDRAEELEFQLSKLRQVNSLPLLHDICN